MSELWNGFPCEYGEFEGKETKIVFPKESNGRLAIKTEYWGAFPAAIEIPLLEAGFHLCYIQNDNRWGTDVDLDRKARLVRAVQEKYGLEPKVVPVGMSCGGLMAIKFAAKYPRLVACLYLDAYGLNYMSCPCHFGLADSPTPAMSEILDALQLDVPHLLAYRDMPLDHLPKLVENKIPVVMVAGDSDHVVPYIENGALLQEAYETAGLPLEVTIKPGCDHHPHGLEDPTPVVEFILKHA